MLATSLTRRSKPWLKEAAFSPWKTMRMILTKSVCGSGRNQIAQAAIQQRWIDFAFQDIEHAVDESDEIVEGSNSLVQVPIGDGIQQRYVAVDRALQAL